MTTQLGDDRFTVFATSCSKSRRNFLEILRAGHDDDVLNAAAVADMAEHGLAGPVIDRLALHPSQHFADRPAWPAHLEALGLTRLEVTPAAGSQGRPPVVAPERRAVNRRRALGQHP